MQLKFTSGNKRKEFLRAAEELIDLIEPQKQYPFDFICFKITGYHPKGLPEELIDGRTLADDLQIFLWKLSGQVDDPVSEKDEKVYTIEQFAEHLGITVRTISRWRRRGLVSRKFTFDDGKKRLGLTESCVEKFLKSHPDLAVKAGTFTRLDPAETERIIAFAKQIAAKRKLSRRQAILKIAKQTGRAKETVRIVLLNYETRLRRRKLFKQHTKPLGPHDRAEICKQYKQGGDANELADTFGRSKSTVYRIIRQKKQRSVLSRKIEYVPSEQFEQPDADELVLGHPLSKLHTAEAQPNRHSLTGGSLSKYLQEIKNVPRLTRDEEAKLFRQYNYLKFSAARLQKQMRDDKPSGGKVNLFEKCLQHVEVIKNTIIEANLPLVAGIASRHTSPAAPLQDLISEGNLSMMRAIEGFNYTKGFRFSTYASWIIAKDFARKLPARGRRRDVGGAETLENVQRDLRVAEGVDFGAIERARHSLVQVIKDELDEREQYVILNHYGLLGSSIIKKTKTLQQIGDNLKLTGERIRQVELSALQKLKQSLSIEEFELLTG